MDTIEIKNNNENIVLYFEGNKYWGTVFHKDGTVSPVDEDVFKYFNMFVLSNNRTELPNEGEYRVILDNETNFKHYFLNNKEDYEKLFLNNGEDYILYKDYFKDAHRIADQLKEEKEKKPYYYDEVEKPKGYKNKSTRVYGYARALLTAFMMFNQILVLRPDFVPCRNYSKFVMDNCPVMQQDDVTIDMLRDKLYSSKYLNKEEKDFLFNEDFLNDILPIINKSNYSKGVLNSRFEDIKIVSFDGTKRREAGFYSPLFLNKIYVADYSKDLFEFYKYIISHEFIHLCQEGYDYSVLTEGCAEIMSFEYYGSTFNTYRKEQFVVRKLMETIGSRPVLEYIINGEFDLIEDLVRPCLTDKEYELFLHCLKKTEAELPEKEKDNLDILSGLIDIVYRERYNEDPTENKAIMALSSPEVSRYYFNRRKADLEHSYYYAASYVPLKEAMEKNYVFFYTIRDDSMYYLTYDELMAILEYPTESVYCFTGIEGQVLEDFSYFYTYNVKEYLMPFNNFGPVDEENNIIGKDNYVKQLRFA